MPTPVAASSAAATGVATQRAKPSPRLRSALPFNVWTAPAVKPGKRRTRTTPASTRLTTSAMRISHPAMGAHADQRGASTGRWVTVPAMRASGWIVAGRGLR